MRDIEGVGELRRQSVLGDTISILSGPQHDDYVRQRRGEIINEFSGLRTRLQNRLSGPRPPSTIKSREIGTNVHPGDVNYGGSLTGFRGLERVGNLPAERAQPAQPARPAFGKVTLDLLGGLGNLPAEGAQPARGARPAFGFLKGVQEFFRMKGGYGGLGTIPARGNTRGFKASDFVKVLYGHADALKSGQEAEFDMRFAHGKDKFRLGSDIYPTSWYVVKASAPTVGSESGKWKREYERPIELKAGEFIEFENPEHKLQNTDVDFYVTLISVGLSDEEKAKIADATTKATKAIESAEAAIAAAKAAGANTRALEEALNQARDALSKEKYDSATTLANQVASDAAKITVIANKAIKAIQLAEGAVATAKAAGVDTSEMEEALNQARDALSNGKYDSATTTANQVAKDAINAKALKEKEDLERKKMAVMNDPTLDAKTKQKIINDIENQKNEIDINANTKKSELPFAFDWKIVAAVAGGIAVIGVAAFLLRRKK